MAELKGKEIFKDGIELLSISEYIKKYMPAGLTQQAIAYAMEKDKIDYTWVGTDRYVVMTAKTRTYAPSDNKTRDAKPAKTERTKLSL